MPALTDRPGQKVYIQKVSARLAAVLKVGLGDHIHCSIFRKYPKDPPPVEKMEADLGASYKGFCRSCVRPYRTATESSWLTSAVMPVDTSST